jgi:hypothetical protein
MAESSKHIKPISKELAHESFGLSQTPGFDEIELLRSPLNIDPFMRVIGHLDQTQSLSSDEEPYVHPGSSISELELESESFNLGQHGMQSLSSDEEPYIQPGSSISELDLESESFGQNPDRAEAKLGEKQGVGIEIAGELSPRFFLSSL